MTDPTLNHWDHIDTRAIDAACREQPVTPDDLPPGVRMSDIARLEMEHGTVMTCADLRRALDGPDCSAFAPGEPAPSWCVPTVVYLSLLGISVLAAVVAVIGGLR